MKKIIKSFLILLSTITFAQSSNWTSVKETNINYGSAISFDLFTNKVGNHIIIQESNALKYYKMNLNGTAGTAINIETSSVVSPSITGNDNIIYIVYVKNSPTEITAKYSEDGGSTWNYISQNPPNSNAVRIEAVLSNNRLHIIYELPLRIIKYRNWYNNGWSTDFTVSDNYNGDTPRITAWKDFDEDKIYVQYNSDLYGRWREYNVTNNTWSDWRFVIMGLRSGPAGLSVGRNYLYYYFYFTSSGKQLFQCNRYNRITGSLVMYGFALISPVNKLFSATTKNEISHTVFYSNDSEKGLFREYNDGLASYPLDLVYYNSNQLPVNNPPANLSSNGNDVHVVWKDNLGNNNGNNLRYRYDDQAPYAPQNLVLTRSEDNHPLLSWQPNSELDLDLYKVYRWDSYGGGWQYLDTTSNTNYEDQSLEFCTVPPPQQCPNERTFQFRVTAIDISLQESNPSNIVETRLVGDPPTKASAYGTKEKTAIDYSLGQNYPNSFNPTTTISYTIPKNGLVALRVYDILGSEVAELVNEVKEAGDYSVTFNASNLPSGIYFYTLTSGNFTATKKLILLK
jgi:hypothetical protein